MLLKHPRGAVFWLNDQTLNNAPSIQAGSRPCVVVSNNTNNIHSPVLTVVPITSQVKNKLPVHVTIPAIKGVGDNIILCEQIKCVSKEQLKDYYGVLDSKTMQKIELALKVQLGLQLVEEKIETKSVNTDLTQSDKKDAKEYSDEYKRQFLEDASKMSNNSLAKKYGITAKASSARKSSWIRYFENKSK